METVAEARARNMEVLVGWTLQDIAIMVANPAHVSVTADGHQLRVELTQAGRTWLEDILSKRARAAMLDIEHIVTVRVQYNLDEARHAANAA